MLNNVLALTIGLAATASASADFSCTGYYWNFYNRVAPALSYQRLDPNLYPGVQSPHLHSFDGGNGLTASSTFGQLQSSTCTTNRIKPDKSLYWRPTLYWNGNNTGFYRVPEEQSKIYYKFGDNGQYADVTAFPAGFKMLAGDPFKRSATPNDPAGIEWTCHGPPSGQNGNAGAGFPPNFSSCQYGLAVGITFPSCWNGQTFNPNNPRAHMAYPTGAGVGLADCPSTHQAARFPTIFIEFGYDVSSFNGHYNANDKPWVLSMGDPTGFGMHADFLNGWEAGVLEKAIAQNGGLYCGCGCGQDSLEKFFGAQNVYNDQDADFQDCVAQHAYSPAEDQRVVAKLPGCNPLQSGPADATLTTGPGCFGEKL